MPAPRVIQIAARRAFRKYRSIPGLISDREDFEQEAALALCLMGNAIPSDDKMLYVVVMRRMIDVARKQAVLSRAEWATGDWNVRSFVSWEAARTLQGRDCSPADAAISAESQHLSAEVENRVASSGLTARQIGMLVRVYAESCVQREIVHDTEMGGNGIALKICKTSEAVMRRGFSQHF